MGPLIAPKIEKWIRSVAPKRGWIIAPIILFAAIYSFFFSAAYPEWHKFSQIVHHGVRTEGVITTKEPMNHAGIRYSYSAAGRDYSGLGPTGFGGIPSRTNLKSVNAFR